MVALSPACLAVPAAANIDGGSTGSCAAGGRGCPCYGNGSCDAGLICFDATACFPEGCIPGTLACPCLEGGGCDVGLECQAAQCVPQAGTGSGTGAGSTTSSTPATTGSSSGGSSSGGSGSTGASACAPQRGDGECERCARASCCAEATACFDDAACAPILDCVDATGDHVACTRGVGPDESAYVPLIQCLAALDVALDCAECVPPLALCGGGGGTVPELLWPCPNCAAQNCCSQLIDCRDDVGCSCIEGCLSDPSTSLTFTDCESMCAAGPLTNPLYQELVQCTASIPCMEVNGACYPSPSIPPG